MHCGVTKDAISVFSGKSWDVFLLFQFKGAYFSDGLKPTDGVCSSPEGIFPNILDDIFTQICPSSVFSHIFTQICPSSFGFPI